ncbi:MAG: Holliday junction resolvase RuvX [Anaerovoracaceae bacterium]|jgi:putative Holliday junction resolvase
MRKIALDVGEKTIGVAVCDALGMTAQGVTTIQRIGIKKDTSKVIEYIRAYDCDAVIVGLPISLDGSDSPQTEKVRHFAEKLRNKMNSTGLADVPLVWQDERLTTREAEQVLIAGDVRRERRREVIDKQAAVLIMQRYLDSHPNSQ